MDFLTSQFTGVMGWTLIHSIWQIGLIAAGYGIYRNGIRNQTPQPGSKSLYLVGCIAMLGMILAPIITFGILNHQNLQREMLSPGIAQASPVWSDPNLAELNSNLTASDLASVSGDAIAHPLMTSVPASEPEGSAALFWLVVTWLVGMGLFSLRPILGMLHVRRLVRSEHRPVSLAIQQSGQRIAKQLRIKTAIRIAESALVQIPTVIGYIKPLVLLPACAVTNLNEDQLRLILAHELAHVRRHDYIVNLSQTLVETLLFYHPAAWWLSNEIRLERENCCDDIAAELEGDPASMAQALLALEQTRVIAPALAANGGNLVHRIRRLLQKPRPMYVGVRWSSVAVFVLVSTIAISVSYAESWANTSPNQDPRTQERYTDSSGKSLGLPEQFPEDVPGQTRVDRDPDKQTDRHEQESQPEPQDEDEAAEAVQARVVTCTYAVADLVVTHVPFWMNNPDIQGDKKVDAAPLIELIQSTIEPDSWDLFTIQYYDKNLCLIITHKQHVHDEIADLLTKLRELNDITLETSCFVATVPAEEFGCLPANLKKSALPISRLDAHLLHSYSYAKEEIKLNDFQPFSIFNGQSKQLKLDVESSSLSHKIYIQQIVTPERDKVRTSLNLYKEETFRNTTTISKSGQFVAFDMTEGLGLAPDKEKVILVFRTLVVENVD